MCYDLTIGQTLVLKRQIRYSVTTIAPRQEARRPALNPALAKREETPYFQRLCLCSALHTIVANPRVEGDPQTVLGPSRFLIGNGVGKNPQVLWRMGSGNVALVLLPTASSGGCGSFF